MMIKEFQSQKSLLDYLMQIMPDIQVLELRRFNIPRRESLAANKLFALWLDEKNKITTSELKRPSTVSLEDVKSMEREGLVKMQGDRIEITSRGAEVIKTMILGDDKSAFEDDGKVLDYTTAYANCRKRGRIKTGRKAASTGANNWYQRMK